MRTVYDILDGYLLSHDLAEETQDYYRRMIGVLCLWAKRRVTVKAFTPDLVNRMLLDKQRSGLSCYYRKSLRSAMRAMLGFKYKGSIPGALRPVKLLPLRPHTWTAAEVRLLVDACRYMSDPAKREWWQTIIAAGYYTGLSTKDLWRLRPADIDSGGIVRVDRSKTGSPVAMRLPEPWLTRVRDIAGKNLVWGRPMSKEVFRVTFARIVRKAGLHGTFKVLRKSCGTSVEMLYPGRGHIALGNTRKVFEAHYLSRRMLDQNPSGPDALPE